MAAKGAPAVMSAVTVGATHEAASPCERFYPMAELIFALACKEWADRMAALASYGRQANDQTMVHMAMKIQARAIRKACELLRQIEPAQGANQNIRDGADLKVARTSAAENSGLSERQRKTALRVASIPDHEFEAAIESDDPATVTQLAERGTVRPPISVCA